MKRIRPRINSLKELDYIPIFSKREYLDLEKTHKTAVSFPDNIYKRLKKISTVNNISINRLVIETMYNELFN